MKRFFLFFFIFIIFISCICFGVDIQKRITNDFVDYCNNKFGENNWILNETTGTIKGYIGQSWECISNETIS